MTNENDDAARCHLCHQPLKAGDRNYCAANVRCAGVTDLVFVHHQCIEDHERKMAREAWLNSPELRQRARQDGFNTFGDWFYGKQSPTA